MNRKKLPFKWVGASGSPGLISINHFLHILETRSKYIKVHIILFNLLITINYKLLTYQETLSLTDDQSVVVVPINVLTNPSWFLLSLKRRGAAQLKCLQSEVKLVGKLHKEDAMSEKNKSDSKSILAYVNGLQLRGAHYDFNEYRRILFN